MQARIMHYGNGVGHVAEVTDPSFRQPLELGAFSSTGAAQNAVDAWEAVHEAENVEYLMQTNEGTFGAEECCRAVGTGDPKFGNYSIYERVGGGRRHVGCETERAPGHARYMNARQLKDARKQLTVLRKELKALLAEGKPAFA